MALLIKSCGIYSFSGASIPPDAKTYSVPNITIASSATLAPPNYTQVLQQTVIDKLNAETKLKNTAQDGDLNYSIQVITYNTQAVAPLPNELTAFTRLNISIEVEFVNNKEEGKNWKRTFTSFENYQSSSNLADVEQELISVINKRLVEDVFNASVTNW